MIEDGDGGDGGDGMRFGGCERFLVLHADLPFVAPPNSMAVIRHTRYISYTVEPHPFN
jgi:hypothetical protein